ncbi:MAG: hypothetical protein R6W89_09250, partial [Candidatus Hydrogenedentota bacterium]
FDTEPDVTEDPEPVKEIAPVTITFDHLHFTYPKAKEEALTDVSLHVERGIDISTIDEFRAISE